MQSDFLMNRYELRRIHIWGTSGVKEQRTPVARPALRDGPVRAKERRGRAPVTPGPDSDSDSDSAPAPAPGSGSGFASGSGSGFASGSGSGRGSGFDPGRDCGPQSGGRGPGPGLARPFGERRSGPG
ncbi:hypothetical protein GCM10023335_69440 [Streptomyces siamensis]|uniref:Uncharacterized protein n=1 Tax=Streptomyces siamensis TaxID=1274986 RepID=A0ABP9JES6_9ACTN